MSTNKTQTSAEIAVDNATATVNERLADVGKVETALATARTAITTFEADRKQYALASTLGDVAATTAARKAREGYLAAQADISDLEHALDEAKAKLTEAQGVYAAASRARTREIAVEIIERRIGAAKRFDEHAQGMADAHRDFNDIGDELGALPNFDGFGNHVIGVARRESVIGLRRVESALPSFCGALDASRAASASLHRSEEMIWHGYR